MGLAGLAGISVTGFAGLAGISVPGLAGKFRDLREQSSGKVPGLAGILDGIFFPWNVTNVTL